MNHLQRFAAVIAVAALLGQGCGRPPAAGPEATAPTPSRPTASGSCSNAYYPFKPNTSIVYAMSGTSMAQDFTVTILPPPTPGSHKIEYAFMVEGKESKISQEFTCEGGEIRAKDHLDFASALGQGISFETKSVTGEFLPADLSVGKKWETNYTVVIHTTNEQLKAMIDGKEQSMQISSEVMGEESVTVPAGTYKARKVKQVIRTSSAASPGTSIVIDQTSWFVLDIGSVKTEVKANGAVSSVMEAKKINR